MKAVRGLSPVDAGPGRRAPYFHDGFADNLDEVAQFHDSRCKAGFAQQETDDLVALLKAL